MSTFAQLFLMFLPVCAFALGYWLGTQDTLAAIKESKRNG